MKHIGLFEGIGGFSLAAQWMGWKTIAWCEWNKYCQQILKQHFPEVEGFGDITKTDFTKYANTIDILTGGFPCQPYSQAGKRLGKEDERHLWPEMLRAIREIQPPYVVGENVLGLLNWNGGMVFDEVQTNLEVEGYEVFPYVLPACATNAPHRRDRVWFIAYSNSNRDRYIREQDRKTNSLQGISGQEVHTRKLTGTITGDITNANNERLQGSQKFGSIREIRQIRNEQFTGCVPPNWQDFPTQSALCGRNDGIPNRVDRIKALGNAIVPQVALQIFKAIALIDDEIKDKC